MKIIAFYLPQFHQIPENDAWWGEGFTEWTNVKNGKKYYKWQRQPRVPLNNNYYCLLDSKTQEWQAKLASDYGIYGFCYYHYWFDGHMLLQKPMELMLNNSNIKLPFCICWANEDWTNAWVSDKANVLISQKYGDKNEWKRHYDYLSKFFKDSRYIKEDNKPLFVIYRPEIIPCLNEMLQYWNELAIADGFSGMKFAHQNSGLDFPEKKDDHMFDYDIEMQPLYAKIMNDSSFRKKSKIIKLLNKLHLRKILYFFNRNKGPKVFDYNAVWDIAIKTPPISTKSIPCAFVDFDNTSRRREQGWLFSNCTLENFKKNFTAYYKKSLKEYNTDFMFIFAWNEWAEGGYLEPDTDLEYGYLEVIKECVYDENSFKR